MNEKVEWVVLTSANGYVYIKAQACLICDDLSLILFNFDVDGEPETPVAIFAPNKWIFAMLKGSGTTENAVEPDELD